ncbi:two-component system sporulation sensor kinase B [Paenibacillus sp. PastM-3]|uniref:HAMP domain-containing sensor histidine kinase n=2 Tax=Paenibacillus TaxID=44249 RepID=UPI002476BE6A|nr:HAMP domain-containing sensor histidine kinase [Paenibacillus sp. PastM-3]MDH6508275.1 two-component system sporulation sensor kinase B [Paenibacillus sp. PastM-3]
MRLIGKSVHITAMLLLMMLTFVSLSASGEGHYAANKITEWQMQWGKSPGDTGLEVPDGDLGAWFDSGTANPAGDLPDGLSSAWTRIKLPAFHYVSPAVYIEKLYALHIKVFVEDRLVLEGDRSYIKDNYSLLVPLTGEDNGKTMYIWTSTLQDRIGIKDSIVIGEHSELIRHFVKNGLIDVILGGSFIFVALVLFMCGFFLDREHFSIAVSLSIVIAATGILAITYSPFIYTFYSQYGALSIILLDLGLLSLLPALTFLFEKIFGSGRFAIIRRFRIFQTAYSAFCILCLIINTLADNRFVEFYYFVSTTVIGFIMIAQFVLLIACVIFFSLKKNKDAITFAIGFGTAALTGVAELVWYYINNGDYDLFYWKWALVVFILSLIVILGRRLALNHRQVVKYSRELELFNNELQRSEKMEIISELAASVAHEVRNPLQVTRGFLQLLSEKASGSEEQYLSMALSELDRAANIITDFLTFAKPEFEQISILNVREEFKHIESIMLPLCHLNGGNMLMQAGEGLWVKGNSSKFKQAYINIIKNSIESLGAEGTIQMIAYGVGDKVYIHIQDDGEGMDPEVLSRLGEPYFSNKTKGTGLGLMVTFRIIEAMAGEIRFESQKGAGTEAVTTLPLAKPPEGSGSL